MEFVTLWMGVPLYIGVAVLIGSAESLATENFLALGVKFLRQAFSSARPKALNPASGHTAVRPPSTWIVAPFT